MKTTNLKSLIAAIVCLLAGVQAQAQFKGAAEQYPTDDWSGAPIEFVLSEVAATLGTDAATLGAAIDEYVKAETPATILFAANGTEWAATLEAANHGFWMAADGTPVGYGDNSVWYCSPSVDEAFTTLTFSVGQMPNVMQEGDKGETTITLSFNDKQATFALTLNVIAKPVFNIPEPTTLLEKELNVVGEIETVVEQYPRGGYDGDAVKVKITSVLEALGIDNREMVTESLDKLLFATEYNTGDVEEGGGMKKDSVTNATTAGGIGWWVRPIQNENGEETGECASASWGDVDRFFIEQFAFSADGDTLTCNLGQYPGSCKENEQYYTCLYFIYADKAYRLKYTLKLMEKEQGSGLDAYTKVGEEVAIVEQEPSTDYSTKQVRPDLDAIAAALGCEVEAIGMVALDDKDNFAASTANNGGWWFSSAGTVTAWGATAAMFVEPATNGDYSVMNVGQYPNSLAVGDEVSSNIYFTNGTNYYTYTVTLKVVESKLVEYDFESVETRTFAVQALLDNSYTPNDLITIAPESIEAILGTATPTLYGLAIDSVAAVSGTYSNKYSCDPKPGFWMNKDGRVSVWGDANATVGISWVNNSILRFFQYPNRNAIGDVFSTTLFLVNEETNKMITLNITLSFVETLIVKEIVGTENISLPVSTEEMEVEIDLTKVAEALDVTVENLLDPNNYYLRGLTSAGIYGEAQTADNGLSFTPDGSYDGYGSIYFYLTESENEGKAILAISSNDPVADDWTADAQFCFEVDDMQYVFYAKLMSATAYENGIEDIQHAASGSLNATYDLSGRTILNRECSNSQLPKGLYIRDGKKLIVK